MAVPILLPTRDALTGALHSLSPAPDPSQASILHALPDICGGAPLPSEPKGLDHAA